MVNGLGIHSYVFMPIWSTEQGRLAVQRARRAGFSHLVVPMRDFSVVDADALRAMFEAACMSPLNTVSLLPNADVSSADPAVRRRGIERLRHGLRLARDMGSRHVGGVLYGVLGKAAAPPLPDTMRLVADSLATVAEDARALGIRLALEIVNRYESNLINTVDQALALLRMIDAPNVHLHLDTFHMNIEETDPLQAIRDALPHLVYFELDQNHRGLPDRGGIDFLPMLHALFAAGYSGLIGVEAFSRSLVAPEIAAGVAAWRDLFDDGDAVALAGAALVQRARADFAARRAAGRPG